MKRDLAHFCCSFITVSARFCCTIVAFMVFQLFHPLDERQRVPGQIVPGPPGCHRLQREGAVPERKRVERHRVVQVFQQLAAQEADAVPVGGQRRGCPDVAAFQNFGRMQAAAPQLLQNILALPLGLVLQQQGLPLQPLPGKAALPGGSLLQRVSLAEHGVHPVPAQHPVAQAGMPGKAHIKGQVDLAFQQFAVQLGAGCFLNAELHLRELRAERRKHLRQRKTAPERRHAHMQHTGVCPEQVGQFLVHLPLLAEQPLGVGQIPLARIGAGGAGLTAAAQAAENGAKVIVVEKMPIVGGNSLKATGGMNAADTQYQADLGITDSGVQEFIEDTINGGHGINDRSLVTVMAEQSSDAIDWLTSIGAPLPKVAATGDGILMAEAIGADTVDMDQIQLHPTVYQETGMLVSESVRSMGGILVNAEGKRFCNDMSTRDAVSNAELEQPGVYAYIIFDQRIVDDLKSCQKYISNGLTVSSDSYEGLAKEMGLTGDAAANFVETMNTWNASVAAGEDAEFGRSNGMDGDLSTAPYYAIKIAPGIHHTMGGLKINTDAQVLDTDGSIIPGLYAAGETTGGVHGGNRIGGNAVCDFVVFGRIAGSNASAYAAA